MIYFYGIGSSGIAALMAEDRFLRVGKACKAVNDPHLQRVQSAILGVKDIIVGAAMNYIKPCKLQKKTDLQLLLLLIIWNRLLLNYLIVFCKQKDLKVLLQEELLFQLFRSCMY